MSSLNEKKTAKSQIPYYVASSENVENKNGQLLDPPSHVTSSVVEKQQSAKTTKKQMSHQISNASKKQWGGEKQIKIKAPKHNNTNETALKPLHNKTAAGMGHTDILHV